MKRVETTRQQLTPASQAVQITFSDEVRAALASSPRRLVALESTIISHGMPYPQNLECARELEAIVRARGAVPATIAILRGKIHVGLNAAELELLAKEGRKVRKVSRRDVPHCIAAKAIGATTVSGTILIAQMAGIRIMATGGIGGVHRGGEVSMDVSADLVELGRTRCLVVCAGVKSILDIGRTLEFLETQGVGVAAYGTEEFPAFFTRSSGVKAPLTIRSIEEAAGVVRALDDLQYSSGFVLGVPLPAAAEADAALVEGAIQASLKEATAGNIAGREVTPFILQRVNELTRGKSLTANIALVRHNTDIAAQIAVAWAANK
jgi:pseudouridine-5'-phosphate glycosidase